MKILVGLQIIMGIVKKPTLASYWAEEELTDTPCFRKYMSRNRFQSLLANLHFEDSETLTPAQRAAIHAQEVARVAAARAARRRGPRTRGGRGRGRGRGRGAAAAAEPEPEAQEEEPAARGRGRGGRGRGRASQGGGRQGLRQRAAPAATTPAAPAAPAAPAPPPAPPADPHSIGRRPHPQDLDEDGVDKLKKIRPLLKMVNENFLKYTPKRELALDEGGCPFKGRLKFKTYCPSKPNRYCIKTYQLCESQSGYCSAFDIYTGKGDDDYEQVAYDSGQTTNLVFALLSKAGCIDKGYHVYMDNYYNSPHLCDELEKRATHVIGTLNFKRKDTPKRLGAIRTEMNPQTKIQHRGKVSFRRRGNTLILIWKDKRAVATISTLHKAEMRNYRVHYRGFMVQKPVVVLDYSAYMYGVDLCDQRLQYYHWLRKTVKWWRKMALHIINMCVLNANILHNKYASKKMSSEDFRKSIASMLLAEGVPVSNSTPQRRTPVRVASPSLRIVPGSHFLTPIPGKKSRRCKLCTKRDGRATTRYQCEKCQANLCLYPCFELYHTRRDLDSLSSLKDRRAADEMLPELPRQDSTDSGRASQPNSQDTEDFSDNDLARPLSP